ncbi:hypothetical protein ABZ671_09175 [Micromonospora sp. NPDC006766]|uniref:hypothetical protein n=1 Tax=Micromonospora sp. NPDC006766 TaxID=3154778 RepID=UPI0033E3B85C
MTAFHRLATEGTEAPGAAGEAPGLADRPGGDEPSGSAVRSRPASRRADLFALLLFLAGAFWVTAHGWRDVPGRVLGRQPFDQDFNEWMLAHAAHAVAHLENPFFSTLQNAPDGVNLVTNVGIQLPGVLLAPLTLLGGATLSYLVLITANLAGTAFAWYWVLSRHLVTRRLAAAVGGACCAFAPAMISHSNGHPHITAQWLVPLIVWQVVRLTNGGRPVRDGLILGALVSIQFFVSVEILFILALGCVLALVGQLLFRPRATLAVVPRALGVLAVAGAFTLVLTAYPLWMQWFGPGHRTGHPADPDKYALRLASYVNYATQSLAGGSPDPRRLAANVTEESSFYGWPLALFALGAVACLRREHLVRVVAFTAVASALLSLGNTINWAVRGSGVPGPFRLLNGLPVVDAMVVARFALITTAALGILVAVVVDRLLTGRLRRRLGGVPLRPVVGLALAAALVPVLPMPLPAAHRPSVPHFVTGGGWREYVAPGRTLVPVPVENMTSVRWGTAAGVGFAVPQGYFLGPTSPTDDTGRWGVDPRPTAVLWTEVATGERPAPITVTSGEREQAVADVRHWKADAVVLPRHRRQDELRSVLDACFGPGRRVDDVWVWDVRSLTS